MLGVHVVRFWSGAFLRNGYRYVSIIGAGSSRSLSEWPQFERCGGASLVGRDFATAIGLSKYHVREDVSHRCTGAVSRCTVNPW
jgi:hypothetical protein